MGFSPSLLRSIARPISSFALITPWVLNYIAAVSRPGFRITASDLLCLKLSDLFPLFFFSFFLFCHPSALSLVSIPDSSRLFYLLLFSASPRPPSGIPPPPPSLRALITISHRRPVPPSAFLPGIQSLGGGDLLVLYFYCNFHFYSDLSLSLHSRRPPTRVSLPLHLCPVA